MKKVIFTTLILGVIGVPVYWFREPILVGVGKWLVVETPMEEADLIAALRGSRERQDKAADLF